MLDRPGADFLESVQAGGDPMRSARGDRLVLMRIKRGAREAGRRQRRFRNLNQFKAAGAAIADRGGLPHDRTPHAMSRLHPTPRTPVLRPLALASLLALGAVTMARAQAAADASLQTVVVTATRHATLAIDAPAALSVVTREQLEARGADNVLDAIRAEPGLSLQGRAVGGRKVLSMRGLDARHTLFLVNGQRVSASDGVVGASDFQYDWLSAMDVERIEVVRGPLSVLYGSEALGGVVNVITRRPGERWRFGAAAEAQRADGGRGGDGWRAAVAADGPLAPGLSLGAGLSGRALNPVATPTDARLSEGEGRDKAEGWLNLYWTPVASQRLGLSHRRGDELRDAGARERSGARRFHQTVNHIERAMSTLQWDADWRHPLDGTEPLQTQLRAYRATLDVANRRTAGVAVNPTQGLQDDVVDGQLQLPLGDSLWTAGAELRNESLADPGLPGGRSLARHRAGFVQWESPLVRDVRLTAGLRADEHSRYGSQLSPRVYAVWTLNAAWTLKGGYSRGFKAPNLKQIVPGTRAEGPNLVQGHAALSPELSDGVEAAVAWRHGGQELQLVAFEQRLRDMIELRLVSPGTTPGTGTYVYENLSRARFRGLEASWLQRLGGGFTLNLGYQYLDAHNAQGQRLDRRPRHAATARLDWQQGPWKAGVDLETHAGLLLPAATTTAPPVAVPAVRQAGAHAAWRIDRHLELGLGVRNLGNVRLQDDSPLYTHAEAPRTWRVTLRGQW